MCMPPFSSFYEATRFLLGWPQETTMEILLSLKHCKDAQRNGNIKHDLLKKLYSIIVTYTFKGHLGCFWSLNPLFLISVINMPLFSPLLHSFATCSLYSSLIITETAALWKNLNQKNKCNSWIQLIIWLSFSDFSSFLYSSSFPCNKINKQKQNKISRLSLEIEEGSDLEITLLWFLFFFSMTAMKTFFSEKVKIKMVPWPHLLPSMNR